MLVVDLNALKSVRYLDLLHDVILSSLDILDSQDIMRIYISFCQLFTDLYMDLFPVLAGLKDLLDGIGAVGDKVSLLGPVLCGNIDLGLFLVFSYIRFTFEFGDDRYTLGLSGFKKLLYTSQTAGDISAGNTACMEGSHGKLRTGLTY